jgi:hypothetical protein
VDEAVSETEDEDNGVPVARIEDSELTGSEEDAGFESEEVEDSAIETDDGVGVAVESSEDDL